MHEMYNELEKLCDTTKRELKDANEKIRNSGGRITNGDMDYLDKLTHMIKSIKTTMAMIDAEDEGYFDDGSNMSGTYGNNSYRSYPKMYGARGRGSNARRDSMGRYAASSRSYRDDGSENMMSELHELMESAPNDHIRRKFEKFISEMETM